MCWNPYLARHIRAKPRSDRCVLHSLPTACPVLTRAHKALNCLGNVCVHAGAKLQTHTAVIFRAVWASVSARAAGGPAHHRVSARLPPARCRLTETPQVLSAGLRALQFVVAEGRGVHVAQLAGLAATARTLMLEGVTAGAAGPPRTASSRLASPNRG
jgi:hypothetical protein